MTLKPLGIKPPATSCGGGCVGLSKKPAGCEGCPQRSVGVGFVPDERPEEPLVAMVLEAPGEDEAVLSRPLVGKAGQAWLRRLIYQNGFKREDVLIANCLRCRPPENLYPIGKMRVEAERNCRQYDDKLIEFNPTLYIVTLHPAMLLRSSAMMRLVQKDVRMAFEKAKEGHRVCLLMGDKAMHLVAPWLKDGVKKWRGHWWEQEGWRTKFG